MIHTLTSNYSRIQKLNYLFLICSLALSSYLFLHLPAQVPTYFDFFGTPSNMGGKAIVWGFPLIFLVSRFLFSENRLPRLFASWTAHNNAVKIGCLGLELLLWCFIFRVNQCTLVYSKKLTGRGVAHMHNTLTHLDSETAIIYLGFAVTAFLLLMALLTKFSSGLFLARTFLGFQKDRYHPNYKKERAVGAHYRRFVFRYISPIFIGFAVLSLMKLLQG
ncbi:hypothetical protein IGI37_002645 [Enterococcus sp. AZ194]|uniref:DUF1648 domain-containing protein n=1 Tax=Enterococcus sp. AZ194 TaxID=2774629 RepID=UPI003F2129C9